MRSVKVLSISYLRLSRAEWKWFDITHYELRTTHYAPRTTHPDSLAFVLMMIELDGCLRCNSNNFKFLRGCFLCATQTVQSFKGTDNDLLEMYNKAKHDLGVHLQQGHLQQGLKPGEMKIAA